MRAGNFDGVVAMAVRAGEVNARPGIRARESAAEGWGWACTEKPGSRGAMGGSDAAAIFGAEKLQRAQGAAAQEKSSREERHGASAGRAWRLGIAPAERAARRVQGNNGGHAAYRSGARDTGAEQPERAQAAGLRQGRAPRRRSRAPLDRELVRERGARRKLRARRRNRAGRNARTTGTPSKRVPARKKGRDRAKEQGRGAAAQKTEVQAGSYARWRNSEGERSAQRQNL